MMQMKISIIKHSKQANKKGDFITQRIQSIGYLVNKRESDKGQEEKGMGNKADRKDRGGSSGE